MRQVTWTQALIQRLNQKLFGDKQSYDRNWCYMLLWITIAQHSAAKAVTIKKKLSVVYGKRIFYILHYCLAEVLVSSNKQKSK